MRTPRIALIGCGTAAAIDLAALKRLGFRPALFIDADPDAARRLARGAPFAATPAEAIDRFDAAIVTGIGAGCTSALREVHATGKPVLCAPEALAAAACLDPNLVVGRSTFAPSHLRFSPGAERARSLLQDGKLGSLVGFEARFGAAPPPAARFPDYWDRRIAGGGALIEPGVHLLDLLAWWLGPLSAESLIDDCDGGVEAEAIARVAAGGATGVVELSRLRTLGNAIALTGTRGRLELDLGSLALSSHPGDLVGDREAETMNLRSERTLALTHRRRIERWLGEASSSFDSLGAGSAVDTLRSLYARRKRFFHAWEPRAERADTQLAGRAVLVTGATGFIGARLVERLSAGRAKVTVAARDFKRVARIARFDIRLARADLGSTRDLDALTRGQDVVFSLAYDFQQAGAANLEVHRNVAGAAARGGIARFVHLSSIAVYDDWPEGSLDEASPRDAPGSEYKAAKRAMEIDLEKRAVAGALHSTVLQPTIVYGPFGGLWTDRFVERLRLGKIELPREGLGLCNGVYVDDVVDALLAAASRESAADRTYIVSGAAPFAWSALFECYADALGRTLDYGAASAAPPRSRSALGALKLDPFAFARLRPARWLLAVLRERLGEDRLERLRARIVAAVSRAGPLVYRPVDEDPRLYLSRGRCSIARARGDLDFEPAFDRDEGLRRTRDYIRWRYLGASPDPTHMNDEATSTVSREIP